MKRLFAILLAVVVYATAFDAGAQTHNYQPDKWNFSVEAHEVTPGEIEFKSAGIGHFYIYTLTGKKLSVDFTMHAYITGTPVFIIDKVDGKEIQILPVKIQEEDFRVRRKGGGRSYIRLGFTHQFTYNDSIYFISLH